MTGTECTRLNDLAPELALGLLDGAERAEVLAHLERCANCHADVASLTELGEQLLLLAPEVPPPAGFESRVLASVAAAEAPLPHTSLSVVPTAPADGGRAGRGGRSGRGGRGDRAEGGGGAVHMRRRRFPYRALAAVAASIALIVAFAGLMVGMGGSDGPTVAASAPIELDHGDLGSIHEVSVLDGNGKVWCTGTFE
jgi:hypothetical protein